MNADGKIYIIITDKLPSGTVDPSPVTPDSPQPGTQKEKEGLFSHWARQRLLNEMKSLSKSAVNFTLGNIGNFTGDYLEQAHVNDAVTALGRIASIGTATIAGFKYGGAQGAVLAAMISVVNQGVQVAQNIFTTYTQTQRTNYQISQLRERSGLNTLLDGSRGTEN